MAQGQGNVGVGGEKSSMKSRNCTAYLGVLCLNDSWGGMASQKYNTIISDRYESGNSNVKKVFDKFADKLLIQNADYSPLSTPHYAPQGWEGHPRGVYYNAEYDEINIRGAGSTYFHELAHMIDHAAGNYQYNISNTDEFAQKLLEEGQRILKVYEKSSDAGKQSFVEHLLSNDRTHSFQDLLDATTGGAIRVSWSHDREYWQHPGSLQNEAFAHFFEASMGCLDKWERFQKFFPESTKMFEEMIKNIMI